MTLGCAHVFSSWENGGGRLFNPPQREHVLKPAESHRCEVNRLGTFAGNFSTFFKGLILENCLQNLYGVTDFSQENL